MKLKLLLILLLTCHTAMAQTKPKADFFKDHPNKEIITGIFKKQMLAEKQCQSKTTSIKKRLVADAYSTHGLLQDSTVYTYSFGRGSAHPYSSNYIQDFSPTHKDFCQPEIKYETKKSWTMGGAGLVPTWHNMLSYDHMHRAIEFRSRYGTNADYTYTIVYGINGLPISISEASKGVAQTVMTVSYNAQNKRIQDSSYNLVKKQTYSKRQYSYDANGNQTLFVSHVYDASSGSLTPSFRAYYTYDQHDRLLSDYNEYMSNGNWVPLSTDTFAYTGIAAQYTYAISYLWNQTDAAWEPEQKRVYHLNARNDIDTYYIFTWSHTNNDFDTLERDVCHYGADHLMQYAHGFLYTGGGRYSSAPYDQTVFYWQPYDPTEIIQTAPETRAIVYPNPSTGTIIVKASATSKGNLVITDFSGRVLFQQRQVMLNGYSADISGWPPGSYMVTVTNESGEILVTENLRKL